MLPAPSGHRVPALPRRDRGCRARRAGGASDLGQLCDPQDSDDPQLAGQASALARAPDADQQFVAEPGGALLRPADWAADPPWRSAALRNSKPPSTPFSTSTTLTQGRSSGSNPPTTFSLPSNASALTTLRRHDMADLWFRTL